MTDDGATVVVVVDDVGTVVDVVLVLVVPALVAVVEVEVPELVVAAVLRGGLVRRQYEDSNGNDYDDYQHRPNGLRSPRWAWSPPGAAPVAGLARRELSAHFPTPAARRRPIVAQRRRSLARLIRRTTRGSYASASSFVSSSPSSWL